MANKEKATSFRLLYEFLNDMGLCSNQQALSDKFGVDIRTINNWVNKGLPKDLRCGISHSDIFDTFFQNNNELFNNFLFYIEDKGVRIPSSLRAHGDFKTFFISFLKAKLVDCYTSKPTVVKSYTPSLESKKENYFEQSIYLNLNKEEIITLSTSPNTDFSKLINHKHILVEGIGGQGKSLFINKLFSIAKSAGCFSYVIKISLSDLTAFTENILTTKITEEVQNYIALYLSQNENIDINDFFISVNNNEKPVLILLDGLNEVYSVANKSVIRFIENSVKEIEKEWDNACIIITSRPSKVNSLIANYSQTFLSGVPATVYDDFLAKHPNIDDSVKDLAKIPLYFNHLSSTDDILQFKTKYDVLYNLYNKLTLQNQSSEFAIAVYFSYYVIAPIIAQFICETSGTTIKDSSIKEIIENEITNNQYLDFLLNIVLRDDIQDRYGLLTYKKDPEQIFRILLSGGLLAQDSSSNYFKFYHDDLRDFLVAYGNINKLKLINEIYNEDVRFDNFKINFNFSNDISTLTKEVLKSKLQDGKMIYDIDKYFSAYLSCTDNEALFKKIAVAHAAFFISDYLAIPFDEIKESIHGILNKAIDLCYKYHKGNRLVKKFQALPEKVRPYYENALANVICKECEYYRREALYEEAFELIKMAEEVLPKNDHVQHHKAKLLLFEYQARKNNHEIKSHIPNCYKHFEELFITGMDAIIEPAKNNFNLSTNLLGLIYSKPSPFIFDVCQKYYNPVESFWLYYETIFTNKLMVSYFSKEQTGYTNTEILYTARQIVSLLLSGTVEIFDDYYIPNTSDIEPSTVVKGSRNPMTISTASYLFADYILTKISSLYTGSLNYLRGRIALYKQEHDEAYRLFKSESDNFLSLIMLKYRFDEDVKLEVVYEKVISLLDDPEFDTIDKTHPIYIYCDMKCLELSLNPNCKEKFNNYESRMSENCLKIVKQLTQ